MLSWILVLLLAFSPSSAARCRVDDKQLESAVLEIIRRHPEVVFEAVMNHHRERARAERLALWKAAAEHPVFLDLTSAPKQGPHDAPLTLVEIADFRCPACAAAQPAVETVMRKYKGRIQLAYLHAASPSDALSGQAARAAWAAHRQGRFFEYKAKLFALQGQVHPEDLTRISRELSLDMVQFERDRQSDDASRQINADMEQVKRASVPGTPTFVLNGVLVSGTVAVEDFDQLIQIVSAKVSVEQK